DRIGQSRLGWSVWNGVQGDTYRWGKTTFEGYGADAASPVADGATPVAGSAEVDEPVVPLDVAQSTRSPQSIAQSAMDGVPLAGRTPVADGEGLNVSQDAVLTDGNLTATFESGSNGVAWYFVVDADGAVVTEGMWEVAAGEVAADIGGVGAAGDLTLLVSFETEDGSVQALSLPVSSAS
ncbi:MAG: hypothetical protein H0T72_06095, partial [Chloroflexia bacterium]|nr:hypothetical protein [Chloroflexia bacterium]